MIVTTDRTRRPRHAPTPDHHATRRATDERHEKPHAHTQEFDVRPNCHATTIAAAATPDTATVHHEHARHIPEQREGNASGSDDAGHHDDVGNNGEREKADEAK